MGTVWGMKCVFHSWCGGAGEAGLLARPPCTPDGRLAAPVLPVTHTTPATLVTPAVLAVKGISVLDAVPVIKETSALVTHGTSLRQAAFVHRHHGTPAHL